MAFLFPWRYFQGGLFAWVDPSGIANGYGFLCDVQGDERQLRSCCRDHFRQHLGIVPDLYFLAEIGDGMSRISEIGVQAGQTTKRNIEQRVLNLIWFLLRLQGFSFGNAGTGSRSFAAPQRWASSGF